jgi:hypothetical protein
MALKDGYKEDTKPRVICSRIFLFSDTHARVLAVHGRSLTYGRC